MYHKKSKTEEEMVDLEDERAKQNQKPTNNLIP